MTKKKLLTKLTSLGYEKKHNETYTDLLWRVLPVHIIHDSVLYDLFVTKFIDKNVSKLEYKNSISNKNGEYKVVTNWFGQKTLTDVLQKAVVDLLRRNAVTKYDNTINFEEDKYAR